MSQGLKLLVESGPRSGEEIALVGGRLTLGREPGVDVVLPGDDAISRLHAEIVSTELGYVVRNQSPNGTFVNGQPAGQTPLIAGDRIAIGAQYVLVVGEANAPARLPVSRPAPPARSRPAVSAAVASRPAPPTRRAPSRRLLPTWVVVYLWFMGALFLVLFLAFGLNLAPAGADSLAKVRAEEKAYGTSHNWRADETDRLLALLDRALVAERQGDTTSAVELYREALAFRRPPDASSPVSRYATGRMAALATGNP